MFAALALLSLITALPHLIATRITRLANFRKQKSGVAVPDLIPEGASSSGQSEVKEMVAASAAAVVMGLEDSPPEAVSLAGERWRSYGRQEIMRGRQHQRVWRR